MTVESYCRIRRKSRFLLVESCKKNLGLYTAMKLAVTLYLVCKLQKTLVISQGSAGSAGSAGSTVPRSAVPQISATLSDCHVTTCNAVTFYFTNRVSLCQPDKLIEKSINCNGKQIYFHISAPVQEQIICL